MTYDYQCYKCDLVEEKKHSMMEQPEFGCACGGKMRKVILQAPIFDSHSSGFVGQDIKTRIK